MYKSRYKGYLKISAASVALVLSFYNVSCSEVVCSRGFPVIQTGCGSPDGVAYGCAPAVIQTGCGSSNGGAYGCAPAVIQMGCSSPNGVAYGCAPAVIQTGCGSFNGVAYGCAPAVSQMGCGSPDGVAYGCAPAVSQTGCSSSNGVACEKGTTIQKFIEEVNASILTKTPDIGINIPDYIEEFARLSKFYLKYIVYSRNQEYDAILNNPALSEMEQQLAAVQKIAGVEDNPEYHSQRLNVKTQDYIQHAKTVDSLIDDSRIVLSDEDIIRVFCMGKVKDDAMIGIALMYALRKPDNVKEVAMLYRLIKEVESRGSVQNRGDLKVVTTVLLSTKWMTSAVSTSSIFRCKRNFFKGSESEKKMAKLGIECLGYDPSCLSGLSMSSKQLEIFLESDGAEVWGAFIDKVWTEDKIPLDQDMQKAQDMTVKGRKVKDIYEEYRKSLLTVYQNATKRYDRFMQIINETVEKKVETKRIEGVVSRTSVAANAPASQTIETQLNEAQREMRDKLAGGYGGTRQTAIRRATTLKELSGLMSAKDFNRVKNLNPQPNSSLR